MKKKSLIIMFTLLMSVSAYTQSGKINVGVYGGAGISSTMMFSYQKAGFGYEGGLQLEYNIYKRISLISGIAYEKMSSIDKIDFNDTLNNPQSFTYNHRFDFITIPLLMRVNFGSKMKIFINAGPSFNYLVYQEGKTIDNINNTTSISSYIDHYDRIEMAIEVGAGVSYPVSDKITMSIELRNKTGLTNISKEDMATQKTMSLLLHLGINYYL